MGEEPVKMPVLFCFDRKKNILNETYLHRVRMYI